MALEDDIESLVSALSWTEKTLERVLNRALARTMRTFAVRLATETAKDAKLPKRPLRQRMRLRARGDLRATLSMITHNLPLIVAGGRQMASGVATRQGLLVRGAFIAAGRYGRLKAKAYRRAGRHRMPLVAQGVPIHEATVANAAVIERSELADIFLKNLMHEVRYRGGLL